MNVCLSVIHQHASHALHGFFPIAHPNENLIKEEL